MHYHNIFNHINFENFLHSHFYLRSILFFAMQYDDLKYFFYGKLSYLDKILINNFLFFKYLWWLLCYFFHIFFFHKNWHQRLIEKIQDARSFLFLLFTVHDEFEVFCLKHMENSTKKVFQKVSQKNNRCIIEFHS